jgi:hypothetical protein
MSWSHPCRASKAYQKQIYSKPPTSEQGDDYFRINVPDLLDCERDGAPSHECVLIKNVAMKISS